mgnify:CR=1 FL=1
MYFERRQEKSLQGTTTTLGYWAMIQEDLENLMIFGNSYLDC